MTESVEEAAQQIFRWGLQRWQETVAEIKVMSAEAEENMKNGAPGPDSGTLDSAIKSEDEGMGLWKWGVKTYIEDIPNPITGWSAAYYGMLWENGHFNFYTKRSEPPLYYMSGGAEEAYMHFISRMAGLWV